MAILFNPPMAIDQSKPLTADLAQEIAGWYVGKEFAYDWTSAHFPGWIAVLGVRERPLRILEIGSYEGRSVLFFLNYFRHSTITCVDWWNPETMDLEIARQIPGQESEFLLAEGRFDRNVAEFGARLTKIKGNSADVLLDMGLAGETFDLVYVDGGHSSVIAYRDCLQSWPLLNRGGVMIMDDYEFNLPGLSADRKPKDGIDAFLRSIKGDYIELHRAYQLIVRRIAFSRE